MSVEATTWAWQQDGLKGSNLIVLLAIADCASGEDFSCFPSHKYLADKARVSVATVRRAIALFVDMGMLKIEPRFNGDQQTSNRYILMIQGGAHTEQGGAHLVSRGGAHNGEQRTVRLTNTIKGQRECPADFKPKPSTVAKIREHHPHLTDADLADGLAQMKAHVYAVPKKDWDAAYRNWMNRYTPKRKKQESVASLGPDALVAKAIELGVSTRGKTEYQLRRDVEARLSA